jgi:16S rRNA (cytosine1402-N4)-methyltransferase
MSEGPHAPVMLGEVLEALEPSAGKLILDGTFGAGGYSRALLDAGAQVLALDRDPSTQAFAEPLRRAFPDRFRWMQSRFSDLEAALDEAGHGGCDGVAFDLGVSSMQLDQAERGFSFLRDGPLDMRMGAEGQSAADLINTAEPAELGRVFFVYGEERQARRIAAAIARRRAERPFERTLDLAETVEKAVGGRRGAPIHPATRVFQALRIAVNQELSELEAGLGAAERALRAGGRLAVVTFHSLEDRIVKTFFAERAGREPAGSRHAPRGRRAPSRASACCSKAPARLPRRRRRPIRARARPSCAPACAP